MDKNEMKSILKKEIIERLELFIDEEAFKDDMPLFGYNDDGEGLGLDSIDVLEIIVILKKNFGVEINANENRKYFQNINTLVELVSNLKENSKV
ncbi:MAG: acyl carrier protein [Clostridiaceae bacterium]|nr:acyl carrier protein [Clostridiaceae bacterium]